MFYVTDVKGNLSGSSGSPALGECSRQFSDQTGKGHIEGRIESAGLWTGIVLEHFHGDGAIVSDDHAGLNHAQQAGAALGFAESAGRINDGVGVVTDRCRMDCGESQADFG